MCHTACLKKFPSVYDQLFVFTSIHPPLTGIDLHKTLILIAFFADHNLNSLSIRAKNCMCPRASSISVVFDVQEKIFVRACALGLFLLESVSHDLRRSISILPIWLVAKFLVCTFSYFSLSLFSLSPSLPLSPLSLESVINVFGCSPHVCASIYSHTCFLYTLYLQLPSNAHTMSCVTPGCPCSQKCSETLAHSVHVYTYMHVYRMLPPGVCQIHKSICDASNH